MDIFKRIVRLCRADIHGVMDKIEDKGLILKQHLREMEDALFRVEMQLADLTASRKRMQKDMGAYIGKTNQLDKEIDAAVKMENDDMARLLIKQNNAVSDIKHELECALKDLDQEIKQRQYDLKQKQIVLEQFRHRSIAFMHRTEQAKLEGCMSVTSPAPVYSHAMEEAVELELLERKQAVKKGASS